MPSIQLPTPSDTAEEIARDVEAIGRISAVPALLKLVCQNTGMGFAAVARVTEASWTACAVQDEIAFGLQPGGQLPVATTLCLESRRARAPVIIDQASLDPNYRDHHTPRIYGIESYISVPIVMPDGSYFGNLCAIDPRPAKVSDPKVLALFSLFAELIAVQLANERRGAEEVKSMAAAIQMREQLLAVVGHDVRNPLAAVSASATLLTKVDDIARARALGAKIQTSARRIAGLVDDVMDFARLGLGGGFHVELQPVGDLDQAFQNVVGELLAAHPGRSIECLTELDERVVCDRARLQQLVSNLLANALTHGSLTAPVRFSARCHEAGVALTVTNEGDPIPPEHLGQIFSPFWRNTMSRHREGLGLGLHICSEIVRAHGGTIDVSSNAADGTTFAVFLPNARGGSGAIRGAVSCAADASMPGSA